jgi:hypothetical protein
MVGCLHKASLRLQNFTKFCQAVAELSPIVIVVTVGGVIALDVSQVVRALDLQCFSNGRGLGIETTYPQSQIIIEKYIFVFYTYL